MRARQALGIVSAFALALSGCGGGGGSTSPVVTPPPPPPTPTAAYAVPPQIALTTTDVERIIAQAANEARVRSLPSVIAVTDRVGNVLAVFNMNGARTTLAVPSPKSGNNFDVQGLNFIPAGAGAIAKAVTGAYLSSGGNAFSTRTASQIVQEHFPPAPTTAGLESGPLYGVQFSSLPCSDLVTRFGSSGSAAMIGPKRTPLGLSADAGGLPLYKNGVLVGGIGVMGDGIYGFDPNILNVDSEDEEFIAVAGTVGYDAPSEIRADRISVDGTLLRFSDATPSGLRGGAAPNFASINGSLGSLVPVRGYFAGTIIGGAAYGAEASGYRAATAAEFSNRDAFILTDGSGNSRFPIRAGTDSAAVAQPLSSSESRALLEEAFLIMTRARAQIRRPLDSRAQVTISLVDTYGSVLGVVRSPDAPIFGTDVSLQKARTVGFFSNPQAATQLQANPSADVRGMFVAARTFFNDANLLTGQTAWADRAIGNVTRPYFPDGEVGRPKGPFSRDIGDFNPFSTGLQSAMVIQNLGEHVNFVLGNSANDTPARCTQTPDASPGQNRTQNGLQIFPGAVPIYRGSTLVGALGVSGDGIDQDDMISFLGTHNAGARAGGIGNAPSAIRSDNLVVRLADGANVRLRYVSCPFAPFLDTAEQNVCQGR